MGGRRSSSFLNAAVLSLLSLSVLLPASLSQSHSSCKSHKFSTKKTFENCIDLPTLNAAVHWTFDAATSALSMAFSAKSDGWIAWGLNPQGSGMVGTQALIAGKFAGAALSVDTYDIQSYHAAVKGPISYNVTGISAEESADGKIAIFGDWALPKGQSTVNQVWQVGPIVGVKPGRHALEKPNVSSRMKLSLAGGAVAGSPAKVPEPEPKPEPTHTPTTTTEPASSSGMTNPTSSPPPVPATSGAGEARLLASRFGLGLAALVVCYFF